MKRSFPFPGIFTLGIIGLLALPPVQAGPKKAGKTGTAQAAARKARQQIQALQVLDGFDQRYGTDFTIEPKKSAWLKRLERELSFVPACEAYVEGDVCMVAGWQGAYRSGRCRISEDRGVAANTGVLPVLSCGNDTSISCNPDLFGLVPSPITTLASEAVIPGAPTSAPRRDAPVCVPRTERRMTMACLRASLIASGAEIPADQRSDLSLFNPNQLSDAELAKWYSHLNAEGEFMRTRPSSASALSAAETLCGHLRSGTRRSSTGEESERTSAQMRETLRSDSSRRADIKDCSMVESLARRIQPVSPPAVAADNPAPAERATETPATDGATVAPGATSGDGAASAH